MKGELLNRLSKEKPENNSEEIEEALRRGYSMKQIMRALSPELREGEERKGILKYQGQRGRIEVPYTQETFLMLYRVLIN